MGWGVEGDTGGPRGGEPRVPGVRSHTQDSLDRFRTHTRLLTTPPRLSPLFRDGVSVGGVWAGRNRRNLRVKRTLGKGGFRFSGLQNLHDLTMQRPQ